MGTELRRPERGHVSGRAPTQYGKVELVRHHITTLDSVTL